MPEEKRKLSKARPKSSFTSKDIENLIVTLQNLGFKITPPTTAEGQEKQEQSIKKLGFSGFGKPSVKNKEEELRATLGTTHIVAGVAYGPGEIILSREQEGLFRSLVHQDRLSQQGHRDTTRDDPYSHCFLVKPGNGLDKHNKFKKVEVSEAEFNSERIWDNVAVSAGEFDIAGYNPGFNAENRSF